MSNLSQKHKDVNDVDEFDAIRVHMDDKVEESREIGDSSKEKVLEEGECVDELIHRDTKDFDKNLQKLDRIMEKLKEAQSKVDADPFNLAKRENAVNLGNEYSQAAEDELKLLHQKAKIRWLEEGDRNTSYFHNILEARKYKSRIESICCEDGKRVEGSLINDQFVQHFQTFLRSSFHVTPLSSMGDISLLKLTETEATEMIKNVSDKEIKEALFDIDSSKAAGLDGEGILWEWEILGEINATLISLVPKFDTPNKRSQTRRSYFSLSFHTCNGGFNMIMVKHINEDGKFKYYHGCKEIKLTHMCFADDLMVLCNGDTDSLQVVKKTWDEFSSVSSLFPNLNKSTIFFGSLNERMKEDMLKILPFKCGNLPMRYVGVPLLAKRLGVKDCQCLIKRKAKVAWKIMCRPKEQGGLGFKPLQKWNAVLLISQLWKLIDKRESLWVKWVNTVKLKGKSIWEAECTNNDSH
uniref:RNA-directed DNA polymerase, eukaryota, reverse transcriptase zinc-binding domain protein n=1 Tax=Tanacetum cinerariifolium TaxID=118510 RepID=A0A699GHD1_TANCI|nr:RNA-directed DNA polymerase, eukaryota, reverse transcriptase zinc-binding domain protein [Tanacetum cinerariifolium]